MMIADRIEPEAADLPLVDAPQAADPLLAELNRVRQENSELRKRLAEIETPKWVALKPAAHRANIKYESLRRIVRRGSVIACRDAGRLFVDARSLDEYISRTRER
ncbi:MAG: hypothetical protein WCA28_07755 [Bradyrhizobium sp.]